MERILTGQLVIGKGSRATLQSLERLRMITKMRGRWVVTCIGHASMK